MKKTTKNIVGAVGLATIAVVTAVAHQLPTYAVSGSGSVNVSVTIVNENLSVKIASLEDGSIVYSNQSPLTVKFDYSSANSISWKLFKVTGTRAYTYDENDPLISGDHNFATANETGTYETTLDLEALIKEGKIAYDDQLIIVVTVDNDASKTDSVMFTYKESTSSNPWYPPVTPDNPDEPGDDDCTTNPDAPECQEPGPDDPNQPGQPNVPSNPNGPGEKPTVPEIPDNPLNPSDQECQEDPTLPGCGPATVLPGTNDPDNPNNPNDPNDPNNPDGPGTDLGSGNPVIPGLPELPEDTTCLMVYIKGEDGTIYVTEICGDLEGDIELPFDDFPGLGGSLPSGKYDITVRPVDKDGNATYPDLKYEYTYERPGVPNTGFALLSDLNFSRAEYYAPAALLFLLAALYILHRMGRTSRR